MKIGDKELGKDGLAIVCEAGSTTRGNPDVAMALADAAKEAGADAIKFIFSDADDLLSDRTQQYGTEGSLYELIKSFEISPDDWARVIDHCNDIGLFWFSSVGTPNCVPMAVEFGCPILKLGCWDIRNHFLLDAFLETGLPIQVDVGAVIYGEVENLTYYIYNKKPDTDLVLLYESHSPNDNEINLESIRFLADYWGHPVGYSSSGRDDLEDLVAVHRYGVDMIEKRICLDDTPGHHVDKALPISGLPNWVKSMHLARCGVMANDDGVAIIMESMKGEYGMYPSMADVAAKSLYYPSLRFDGSHSAGEIITRDKICCRRPGDGWSSYYSYLVLDKTLARDVQHNELVSADAVGG